MAIHRGDYQRIRRAVTIARVELEALEPRMQLAYRQGFIPGEVAADLSLARLMVCELDRLLRHALDIALADTGRYYNVYAHSTYNPRRLAEPRKEAA